MGLSNHFKEGKQATTLSVSDGEFFTVERQTLVAPRKFGATFLGTRSGQLG